MHQVVIRLVAICLAGSLTAPALRAQPSPSSTSPLPEVSPLKHAERVGPNTYLLPDEQGNLRQVLGFRWEWFMEAMRHRNGERPVVRKPRFTFESVDVSGAQSGEQLAELILDLNISIHAAGPLEIPLGLTDVFLRKYTVHDAPADTKVIVQYDAQRQRHSAWVEGREGEAFRLRLEVLAQLRKDGGQTSLPLKLPHTNVSDFSLLVRGLPVAAEMHKGPRDLLGVTQQGLIVSRTPEGEMTRLQAIAGGGPVELVWRFAEPGAAPTRGVLEATADILAKIDGANIAYQARIVVSPRLNEPLDKFQLRLPPHVEAPTVDLPWRIQQTGQPADVSEGALYEVLLPPEPTTKPVEVSISALRRADPNTPITNDELAGFHVLGAVRQSGHVAIQVLGDWQVTWTPSDSIRQVADIPAWMNSEELIAGFEYFRSGWSLRVAVRRREARVVVEPDYDLVIGDEEATWRGKLKCNVRGGKIFHLRVDLAEWELAPDGVSPMRNVVGELQHDDGILTMQLKPTDGFFELNLTASRPLTSGQQSDHPLLRAATAAVPSGVGWLSTAAARVGVLAPTETSARAALRLPSPLDARLRRGELSVSSPPHIELKPSENELEGLTTRIAATASPNSPQQRTLVYDLLGQATFVADRVTHQRVISASLQGYAHFEGSHASVSQRIDYAVRYRPADRIVLAVPEELWANGTFAVRFSEDGPRVTAITTSTSALPDGTDVRHAAYALPNTSLGKFSVYVRWQQPFARSSFESTAPLILPVVYPADAMHTKSVFRVDAAETAALVVEANDAAETWEVADGTNGAPSLTLTANSDFPHRLPLQITASATANKHALLVERMWIQTWQTRRSTRQRIVYRLHGAQRYITLQMPSGLLPRTLEIAIDGEPVNVEQRESARLVVDLGSGQQDVRRSLELAYQVHSGPRTSSRINTLPPQLEGTPTYRRIFWQVVTAEDVHLVGVGGALTSEFAWQFTAPWLTRQPTMTQAQLEAWCGAITAPAIPGSMRTYLFSSFDLPPQLSVSVWRRAWIVLVASGAVLCVTIGSLYLSWRLRWQLFYAGGVSVLLLTVLFPVIAPVLLQASVVGLLLTFISFWMRHLAKTIPLRRQRTETTTDVSHTRSGVAVEIDGSTVTRTVSLQLSDLSK